MISTKSFSAFLLIFFIFSGISCDPVDDNVELDDPRDVFIGSWSVNETCSKSNYTVVISNLERRIVKH